MDRLQREAQRSQKQETNLKLQLEAVTSSIPASSQSPYSLSAEFLDTSSSRNDLTQQVEALQRQLKMARDATNAKDDALVASQEELAETKMSLDHFGAVNVELQNDTLRLKDRLRDFTRRTEELDKEIVASRTSVDFNSLQMSEKDHYIERLQDVIEKYEQEKKDYMSEKVDLSQAEQHNLDMLRKVHEQEIHSLQSAMQAQEESLRSDIEKLKELHLHEQTKLEHESRMTLEKITLEHTSLIHQLKNEDAGESYRLREGLNERIFEKEAEILRLKGVIELEKSRTETQNNVNGEIRKQLASQTNNLEGTSLEIMNSQRKYDALVIELQDVTADNKKFQVVIDSLNLELQHERGALDTLRQEFRETQTTISSFESQVNLYKSEINTLQQLSGGVEDTSRENERLKGLLQASKEDMVDMTTERDHSRMTENITKDESLKKDELIKMAKEDVDQLTSKVDVLSGELRQVQQDFHVETANVVRLEAILNEQRETISRNKSELDALRNDLSVSEQKMSTDSFNSQAATAGFERSCSLLLQALVKWDLLLTSTIDGEDEHTRRQGHDSHTRSVSVEEILKNPDDLFQNSISVVERIQYKIDRVLKIRELFGKSNKTFVSDVERKFDAAQDKVSLMTYRLKALEEKSKHISHEIEKDAQRKELNTQEMKSFQHTVVSEHVTELKEAEERASNVTLQLQSEMHRSEGLEREVLLLQEENSALQAERYEIGQTEHAVSSLSEKFQTMAESNRLMSLEIEERGHTINKFNDQIQSLTSEKNALLAGVQRLTSQIEMRDTILTEHESTVESLKSQIAQLKTRQINPALEKSILDSQNILKSSMSNFNQQVHDGGDRESYGGLMEPHNVDESALTSAFLSDNAVSSAIQTMFEKLSNFLSAVSALSKGSEDMLHRYENLQVATGRQDTSSTAHDMFELLDANSRLSSKLLQLAIDFKRLSRKVLLKSSEDPDKFEGVYYDSSRKSESRAFDHSESKSEVSSPRASVSLEGDPFRKLMKFRESAEVVDTHTQPHAHSDPFSHTDSSRGGSLGMEALLSGSYDSPVQARSGGSGSAYTPVMSQQQEPMAMPSQQYGAGSHSPSFRSQHSQQPVSFPSPLGQSSSSQPPTHMSRRQFPPNSVKFTDSHSRLLSHESQTNRNQSYSSSSPSLQFSGSHHSRQQQQFLRGSGGGGGGGNFPSQSRSSQFSSSIVRDQTSVVPGSRLTKLGNDLQNLAGKLDTFNSSSNNSTGRVLKN